MSTSRPEHLNLGSYAQPSGQPRSNSPTTNNLLGSADSVRSSLGGLPGSMNPSGKMPGATRSGAGSPSHEMAASSRLFSKRAREIQAEEGLSGLPLNPWGGPPTSGNSTPLRENIPESPTDGFPDFAQLPTPDSMPQTRRTRAGTLPSRFSPGGASGMLGVPGLASRTSRPSPSHTPFNKSPSPGLEQHETASNASTLLSRLRAGSMPQRSPFAHIPGTNSPFGQGIFSSNWPSGRERTSTLASIASLPSNGPSSPSHSQFSKEGNGDNDMQMRTLDYLGLAETPQPPRAQLATPYMPTLADFTKQANRFRSYSVNNKDKYAEEEEEYEAAGMSLESQYAAHLQEQLAATNAAIHSHNIAVQAFAQAAITRPRARTTAGVLDTPGSRVQRNFYPTPSRLDSSITPADILSEEKAFEDLPQAVAGMSLGRSSSRNNGLLSVEEQGIDGPTSALWLGSIPTSTTTSTLTEMFKSYGPILSARVLTHKNCGFVNFERVDSAIAAKASMNGKEIFPGAGPVRINFAKPPSASNTPGHDGAFPSPSPDPFAKAQDHAQSASTPGASLDNATGSLSGNITPTVSPLPEMAKDMLRIVKQFGASDDDRYKVSLSVDRAIQFTAFIDEIPAIKEPAHTRVHDAPKLRDVRKRIDNQSLSQADIENIAVDMLPEIAELASDYLGNTVVQKLFEHCSDEIRDAMLAEIAPHMAEIGVHKNGTWAAQKIIDVCKSPQQMSMIVEQLRPYTVPLFLDQYGNYVLQGCLKFGAPYNDFIFETMLSRMWEVAQGRFGARAMRACLESHHSTKDQQRMLAAAIALHSVQLATNANGALLLTWFLDTSTFPQRRTVLSPQLVPYLVHLCTHKVAYLTVLKVINQKAEPEARDTILKALFFTKDDQVLQAILSDHSCGATLIFKVLTTPFFDESIRNQVVENVKAVLIQIKAQPGQGYKRLMDEVGLPTRSGGGGGGGGGGTPRDHGPNSDRPRPGSRQTSSNSHHHQPQHQGQGQGQQGPPPQQQPQHQLQHQQPAAAQYSAVNTDTTGQMYNALNAQPSPSNYDAGFSIPRSDSMEPGIPQQIPTFSAGTPAMYGTATPPMTPANLQQLQYQQSMLSRATPPINGFFPSIQAGFGGFGGSGPASEHFRGQAVHTPPGSQMPNMPTTQAPFAAPAFGMGMAGFSYGGMAGMQNVPYVQEQQQVGNGRRGRVGRNQARDGNFRPY